MPKPPTQKQLDKAFAPLALEIGKLTRAWNRLHEALGKIFVYALVGRKGHMSPPFAVWYSIRSDLVQRVALRQAIDAPGAIDARVFPSAKEDIVWVLKETDKLSIQRNDALHAPLVMATSDARPGIEIMPEYFAGNPRALALKDKDLLAEICWYRRKAEVLQNFTYTAWLELVLREPGAWPRRPQLPLLGQDYSPAASSRGKPSKRSRPPPRSSEA
jgi:hypothetical protein